MYMYYVIGTSVSSLHRVYQLSDNNYNSLPVKYTIYTLIMSIMLAVGRSTF